MLVFNNQQRSGYEEIASYSPRYYRGIKEMDAVFRLAGRLNDLMAQDMENIVAFQFRKYMDDEALTRYEAFLEITHDLNQTLEERKAYINALLVGAGKISSDKIEAIISQFSGCICDGIVLDGSTLLISIIIYADLDINIKNGIYDLIKQKLPAHINMDVSFYNSMEGSVYFGGFMQETDIIEFTQR